MVVNHSDALLVQTFVISRNLLKLVKLNTPKSQNWTFEVTHDFAKKVFSRELFYPLKWGPVNIDLSGYLLSVSFSTDLGGFRSNEIY